MACPSGCARLILHNNTRWPIYYATAYDPTVEGAAIVYIIELEDGCRDVRNQVDVVVRNNRLPGKTLTFVVPKADFPDKSKIYINFAFLGNSLQRKKTLAIRLCTERIFARTTCLLGLSETGKLARRC